MNKFCVLKCVSSEESGYEDLCVVLACVSDPEFVLFFPVDEKNAKIINYVLEDDSKYNIDTNVLGIYKTMIDSWNSSDRYLAGIIMDVLPDENGKEELLSLKLVITDQCGLDCLVPVNFIHGILLASMESVFIIVSDKILEKMVSDDDTKTQILKKKKSTHFPEDKKIMAIAKKILSGKLKDK